MHIFNSYGIKKFQYKIIKKGGTARSYGNSLSWIMDFGLGIKVNRLKTFDIPLRAYRDPNAFKFYLNDFGSKWMLISVDQTLNYAEAINIIKVDEINRVVERKDIPLFGLDCFSQALLNAYNTMTG